MKDSSLFLFQYFWKVLLSRQRTGKLPPAPFWFDTPRVEDQNRQLWSLVSKLVMD